MGGGGFVTANHSTITPQDPTWASRTSTGVCMKEDIVCALRAGWLPRKTPRTSNVSYWKSDRVGAGSHALLPIMESRERKGTVQQGKGEGRPKKGKVR